jgi:hypothetical protein
MDDIFAAYNLSELYQTCRQAGLDAHPAMTRETMIAILLGEQEPLQVEHPLDPWRRGIMGFLIEHWKQVETQLTCPAKSKDPNACFGCVDVQVTSCLVTNEANLHLIRLHRK